MSKVNIPKSGRIVCTVYLRPYHSPILQDFDFKIDTGADFSTISKDTLYELGYTDSWINKNKTLMKGITTTATGEEVESYYIRIPFISVYGARGKDYPFAILLDRNEELPKPTCKGCKHIEAMKFDYRLLLGNDILSCFNINIDRDNNFLYLNRLSNLDKRNAKYPDKQLNFIESEE